jgi:hypothetical protein
MQHPDEITPSQLPLLQVIFTDFAVPSDNYTIPKIPPYNKQNQ